MGRGGGWGSRMRSGARFCKRFGARRSQFILLHKQNGLLVTRVIREMRFCLGCLRRRSPDPAPPPLCPRLRPRLWLCLCLRLRSPPDLRALSLKSPIALSLPHSKASSGCQRSDRFLNYHNSVLVACFDSRHEFGNDRQRVSDQFSGFAYPA